MKRLLNSKGMAFVNVILAMVIAIILVTAMLTLSLNENIQAIDQSENMKAYYIARSGAESMVHRLLTIEKDYWDDFTTEHTTTPMSYSNGMMSVKVKRSGNTFNVSSNGLYNGESQDVEAELFYNPYTKLEYAIYTIDPMVDLQLGELDYDIGSGGTIGFKTPSYDNTFRPYANENVPLNISYDEPDLPTAGELTSDTDFDLNSGEVFTTTYPSKVYNTLASKNGATWIIDVNNADYKKFVDNDDTSSTYGDVVFTDGSNPGSFDDEGDWLVVMINNPSELQGDIEIIDSDGSEHENLIIIVQDQLKIGGEFRYNTNFEGNVEIYVLDGSDTSDEDLIISSPQVTAGGPTGAASRLIAYLSENSQMTLDVNGEFYGYVIGPEAEVALKNANTEFHGAIYSQVVDIDANVEIYFEFPDGSNEIRVETIQFSHWIK